ncbi:MAG: SRPBCC family protein [Chthonomonadales bacterium]
MHALLALGAPTFELQRTQWVPRDINEVFAFFEDPQNLPKITPPSLGFKILSMTPDHIDTGTLITYRLKWNGIPYRWITLIKEWAKNERFVDTQISGPYILWHHTHTFEAIDDGVLLKDVVRYRLPFGPIGVLMHRMFVKKQLEAIFDYRIQKIGQLLSDGNSYSTSPGQLDSP